MNKFALIALVGCSLGILIQAVVIFDEPFETAVNPLDKEQNIDSSHEGIVDDLNNGNAPDVDDEDVDEIFKGEGDVDVEDEEDVDDEDYDEEEDLDNAER